MSMILEGSPFEKRIRLWWTKLVCPKPAPHRPAAATLTTAPSHFSSYQFGSVNTMRTAKATDQIRYVSVLSNHSANSTPSASKNLKEAQSTPNSKYIQG